MCVLKKCLFFFLCFFFALGAQYWGFTSHKKCHPPHHPSQKICGSVYVKEEGGNGKRVEFLWNGWQLPQVFATSFSQREDTGDDLFLRVDFCELADTVARFELNARTDPVDVAQLLFSQLLGVVCDGVVFSFFVHINNRPPRLFSYANPKGGFGHL